MLNVFHFSSAKETIGIVPNMSLDKKELDREAFVRRQLDKMFDLLIDLASLYPVKISRVRRKFLFNKGFIG